MVKHRLSVQEAKALMESDPDHARRLMFYATIFLTIIASAIVAFIYMILR